MAQANETAGEAVSGIRTVKSFRTELGEANRYDVRLMETHNLKTRRDTVRAIYLLVRRVSMSLVFKCICVLLIWNCIAINSVFLTLVWFADYRIGNEGGHALLWETLHPVWTDDHRESCIFHSLSARPWRQH